MSAFEDLYQQHRDAVFRFVWHRVGRRSIAEEITAETFLALFEHLDSVDLARMPGWLFTVARHRATDFWRRQLLEDAHLQALQAAPPAAVLPSTSLGLLESDLLKPLHRICLDLRYGHGMTLAEIACHTGLSEIQVKGYLQYARELLKKELLKAPT